MTFLPVGAAQRHALADRRSPTANAMKARLGIARPWLETRRLERWLGLLSLSTLLDNGLRRLGAATPARTGRRRAPCRPWTCCRPTARSAGRARIAAGSRPSAPAPRSRSAVAQRQGRDPADRPGGSGGSRSPAGAAARTRRAGRPDPSAVQPRLLSAGRRAPPTARACCGSRRLRRGSPRRMARPWSAASIRPSPAAPRPCSSTPSTAGPPACDALLDLVPGL